MIDIYKAIFRGTLTGCRRMGNLVGWLVPVVPSDDVTTQTRGYERYDWG
jgi:hypothetical protein